MENIIAPSTFLINSCTMENNKNVPAPFTVEELHNLDLSGIDPTPPKKIYDELVRILGEAHQNPTRNAPAGPSNQQAKEEDGELKYEEEPRSKQTSLALTENIHPGYPYRENLGENDNLPMHVYPRPYLAAQTDQVSGDPRIRGKEEKGSVPYNEGN
jgi:hypothetical protein